MCNNCGFEINKNTFYKDLKIPRKINDQSFSNIGIIEDI